MKLPVLAGLLASFVVACSGATTEPPTDPPVTKPTPDTNDGVKPPTDNPPKTDPPKACTAPLVDPQCSSTKPASNVSQFVKDTAIPIRCSGTDADSHVWDPSPLVALYGDNRMYMTGEVHGTNEIGIVSSIVFEELAKKGLVNKLGYELPMDLEPYLQKYVDTGQEPYATQLMGQFATNFFGKILTQTARDLSAKGIKLELAAVDIPMTPDTAVAAIKAVAAKLTTQKDTVLSTLPENVGQPATPDDVTALNAYFDKITGAKTQICSELSEADCDRLDAMTHALWATGLQYDRAGDDALWFERREVVIYYNMRTHMAAPTDRMYLHMGAHHTNKYAASAGSRMANEYALTKGRVFSVAPAYGDGSKIWYGEEMDLPGAPTSIIGALTSAPDNPVFVSNTRPSKSCDANPIGDEIEDTEGGKRSVVYDGYIHYGQLTSEKKPSTTALSKDDVVFEPATTGGAFAAFRARIAAKEANAIAARGFSR